MYDFFRYLSNITGCCVAFKSNRKLSFSDWCEWVDHLNRDLLRRHNIRWYANPISDLVIKKYHDQDFDPSCVSEGDYINAREIEDSIDVSNFSPSDLEIEVFESIDRPDDEFECAEDE